MFIGFGLCFAFIAGAERLQQQAEAESTGFRVSFLGLAFPFLVIAVFELRSGYAWRNLAPGNRGVAREQSPRRFFASVCLHLFLAAVILSYASWRLLVP